VLKFDPSLYRLVRTAMALKVLRRAQHVVPSSEYVVRHLSRFHLSRPPVAMIPNGLPALAFQPSPVTGRLKGSDGAPVLASILNGWGGLKNGATSLKSFALLRRHYPQARLLMYGGGHGPGEEAESWAAAHGLCQNVDFLGFRPHEEVIQRLRDEVDFLLHPSREEAQGLVLAEAMANGAVVVAGQKAGGVAATLDHGRAGILTDIEDPAAISLCLQKLVADAPHRSALAKAGYEHARRHYHSDTMVSAYEALYRQLAEGMRYNDR
jgi:glycosyltransferase involved in cell wall biosynthesis